MAVRKKPGLLSIMFWGLTLILILSAHGINLGYIKSMNWTEDVTVNLSNFFSLDEPKADEDN